MEANLLQIAQFASTAPAQFLIASLWQGALLTGLAWLALKAAPFVGARIAPSTRFLLWMVVFVLAALLPSTTLLRSHAVFLAPGHADAARAALHLPSYWAVVLVGTWALASLFSMAQLLFNIYRLDVLAKTATPLPKEALSDELRSLLASSNVSNSTRRPIEICLSDRTDTPVVIGFFRAAIVIPRWLWQKVTPAELNQIVRHELAHLGRRDDWTNLLQKVLRALFPLNPALILAERQLCFEREMACDDAVLDASINPKEYATCLTNLAEKKMQRHAQSLAPGAWRRRSELAERVYRILGRKGTLRPFNSRPVVLAFLAAYFCAAVVLAGSPRLVAFTVPSNASWTSEAHTPSNPPRVIPAAFKIEGQPAGQSVTLPHLVDTTFHMSPSFARPKNKRRTPRESSKQRFTRAALTQAHFTDVQFTSELAMAETQFARSAAEISESRSHSLLAPVLPHDSDVQFIFAIWTPSPSAQGGVAAYSRIAAIHSHTGWIVIQL